MCPKHVVVGHKNHAAVMTDKRSRGIHQLDDSMACWADLLWKMTHIFKSVKLRYGMGLAVGCNDQHSNRHTLNIGKHIRLS